MMMIFQGFFPPICFILRVSNLRRREDMWNIMELATFQLEKDMNDDQDLVRRRAFLAAQFQALPSYGSAEFWRCIEETQSKLALPSIMVLRDCSRNALSNAASRDSSRKARRIYSSHEATA
jgi:hypothetical protein